MMQTTINYKVHLKNPMWHYAHISMNVKFAQFAENSISFFLPRWSPGSYLMREYVRHVRNLMITDKSGERLAFRQNEISLFEISLEKHVSEIDISYEVYCHELTVRTSHIDQSHAFLHLPTLLFGIYQKEMIDLKLELLFSPGETGWSKVSTGLQLIAEKKHDNDETISFHFQALNYDELIDSPIEVGSQETFGFMAENVPHELAFYGKIWEMPKNLITDVKKIVETISKTMGGVPYKRYTFINHFVPSLYGGLEHQNSTALHFDPLDLLNRKGYLRYLCLVSHEYFHTWNVKRIRPFELGPFNYLKEAVTDLLWLAEGLTSFVDEWFVLRAGLMSLEEYLEMQKENLQRYFLAPGRKFHTLDVSSNNAWIKLYRPDETLNNTSISYYLKGGIAFWCLHLLMHKEQLKFDSLLLALWQNYLSRPKQGLSRAEFFEILLKCTNKNIADEFETYIDSTIELPIAKLMAASGMELEMSQLSTEAVWWGIEWESGEKLNIKTITLDSPAYVAGLNVGDEVIAIDNLRLTKDRMSELSKILKINKRYTILISRLGSIHQLSIILDLAPLKIKEVKIINRSLVEAAFINNLNSN